MCIAYMHAYERKYIYIYICILMIGYRSVFAVDIIHKMKCFIAKQFQINQTNIDLLHRPCT